MEKCLTFPLRKKYLVVKGIPTQKHCVATMEDSWLHGLAMSGWSGTSRDKDSIVKLLLEAIEKDVLVVDDTRIGTKDVTWPIVP